MIDYSLDQLPFLTAQIPGIGGQVKQVAEDFTVEEIPLYQPAGQGEHLYVTIRRTNMTTRGVQKQLAELYQLDPADIGYAGMKDRIARVTQTFSLPGISIEQAHLIEDRLGYEVIMAKLHQNKLKLGHLAGNHFEILIRLPLEEIDSAYRTVQMGIKQLSNLGMLNFFGPQRFGMNQDNQVQGRLLVKGEVNREHKRLNRWKKSLYISAYQSYLFNYYLKIRHEQGWIRQILEGDVARKRFTGGLFWVRNVEQEQQRFLQGEISYTGPLFGYKMMPCDDAAAELELQLLELEEIELDLFRRTRTTGDRRACIVHPGNLKALSTGQGILLSFDLPPGSFASSLIREVTKLPFSLCG